MRKVIITILALCLLNSVYAIGLRGEDLSLDLDFVPNTELEINYQIVTTAQFPMDYKIIVKGELAHLITIDQDYFKLLTPGSTPWFKAKIKFPDTAEVPPGQHSLKIIVEETEASGDGAITARTAAAALITIRVLYPQAELVAAFAAHDVSENQLVPLVFGLANWGATDIQSAKADIDIFDGTGNKVKKISTEPVSIPSAQSKSKTAMLDTINMASGEYTAKAVVTWDGKKTNLSDPFRIGTLRVKMTDVTTKYNNESISPVEVTVRSEWNNGLDGVYAEIEVADEKLKTPTAYLEPWGESKLRTYWDTQKVKPGTYDAIITLNFAGSSIIDKRTFTVEEKISPETEKPSAIRPWMIGVGAILLILIIINIMLLSRLRKKPQAPQ